jgi:hypothetical protein
MGCAWHTTYASRSSRPNAIGCKFNPLGLRAMTSWAHSCACDKKLHDGFVARFGQNSEGYLRNQRSWFASTWGRCFTAAANGDQQQCVPYPGTVSAARSEATRSDTLGDNIAAAATQLGAAMQAAVTRAAAQTSSSSPAPAPAASDEDEDDDEEVTDPGAPLNRTFSWVALPKENDTSLGCRTACATGDSCVVATSYSDTGVCRSDELIGAFEAWCHSLPYFTPQSVITRPPHVRGLLAGEQQRTVDTYESYTVCMVSDPNATTKLGRERRAGSYFCLCGVKDSSSRSPGGGCSIQTDSSELVWSKTCAGRVCRRGTQGDVGYAKDGNCTYISKEYTLYDYTAGMNKVVSTRDFYTLCGS